MTLNFLYLRLLLFQNSRLQVIPQYTQSLDKQGQYLNRVLTQTQIIIRRRIKLNPLERIRIICFNLHLIKILILVKYEEFPALRLK